ncbi:MAG: hypothetical protein EPO16_05785 [Dehalococcoidia bacterium]|nr:MAG: hypothetical protein EPO16_05785 [Dehalococcoidia bacterium]
MDPDVLEMHAAHRRALLLRGLVYIPSALIATVLFFYALTALPQSVIMVVIVGIFTVPLDMEAVAVIRDLPAQPVVTEGRIERKWDKARFAFFGRVHYLIVEKKLFEVGALAAMELQLGDRVRVEHWPHSHVLVSIARVASEPSR